MSITIHQSPSGFMSAHENLWHVVESTNKATVNYIFDVYKGSTMLTRIKAVPTGPDRLGVVDLSNVVRSLLPTPALPDIVPDDLGADVELTFFKDTYSVRYGEASGTVITANIVSGSHTVYNNYYRSPFDTRQSNISGSGLLSNRPTPSNVYAGEPVVLSYFANSQDGQIWYKGFKNQVESYTGTNNAVVFSFEGDDGVFTLSGSVEGVTDTIRFKKKCSKHKPRTLVFLNAYGAFDSFTFIHGQINTSLEKKHFKQQRWQLSSNAMVEKSGAVYNEERKVYAGEYNQKMVLTSDILSSGEYNWLQELIVSPLVYYAHRYEDNTVEYFPVTISNTDYEMKQDAIQKADTLQVTIEFDKQYIQFR